MMHFRSLAVLSLSGVLAVTSLAGAPSLHAQAAGSRFHPDAGVGPAAASQLAVLSRDRAVRWAMAARTIHCGPAPLTERPGILSELARPRVTPLESAFADAARAKRSFATLPIRNVQ